jgi:Protein of unknown function (DUF3180)
VRLYDDPPGEQPDGQPPGGPAPVGRVPLTPWPVPLALLVIGVCVGWTAADLLDSSSHSVPTATWWMVATWLVFAGALGFGARTTRDRVRTRRIEPLLAVRVMVLGKSAALVGPACGGVAIGLGVWRISVSSDRLTQSGTLAMLALGLVLILVGIAGMALEWACRVPGDGTRPGRPGGGTGTAHQQPHGPAERRGASSRSVRIAVDNRDDS